eukprot:CAMPEP_0185838458 /NCGR_PEP_ID=MMETSP1353-20130828/13087_1 /TAXON_ID=1077150 /ORGANISM="Erythrolobus australicus, Strain CCMP3124" /LENGTH=43 /DNA_ID= /DNA_START= /DNA_END= /DNA_ORIENTATION=
MQLDDPRRWRTEPWRWRCIERERARGPPNADHAQKKKEEKKKK